MSVMSAASRVGRVLTAAVAEADADERREIGRE